MRLMSFPLCMTIDSSEDDYVEGSESEPEELGDDKDDEREDVDTDTNGSIHINAAVMMNDGSKSLQADERLLSNRGLPKTGISFYRFFFQEVSSNVAM